MIRSAPFIIHHPSWSKRLSWSRPLAFETNHDNKYIEEAVSRIFCTTPIFLFLNESISNKKIVSSPVWLWANLQVVRPCTLHPIQGIAISRYQCLKTITTNQGQHSTLPRGRTPTGGFSVRPAESRTERTHPAVPSPPQASSLTWDLRSWIGDTRSYSQRSMDS